jgi:outer membrane usher protein
MLAPGLFDYSVEAGYARNHYGLYSNTYDSRLMASATARYGFSDALTFEGHAEGGGGLLNGGFGAVFNIGNWGLASAAAAGSHYGDAAGFQIAGSLEMPLGDWRLFLRTQRTFGDYQDIASVTAHLGGTPIYDDLAAFSAAPPHAVDQLSLSIPLPDATSLGMSFTNYDQGDDNRYQLASLTYSRPLFGGTLYANGYADLTRSGDFGAFVGFSVPLGPRTTSSVSTYADRGNAGFLAQASRSEDAEPGSYGWRALVSSGSQTYSAVAGSYRGNHGRAEVGVQQVGANAGVTAALQGSMVAAGGGIFFGNQIDDAFAVVDVGAPDVPVLSQNRVVGTTDGSGRLLVPGLRRFQQNRIGIDPTGLPVDTDLPETNRTVTPGARNGVVVDFTAKSAGRSALVSFVDAGAAPIPLGSVVTPEGAGAGEIVGYDGQAYLRGLSPANRVTIELPDGSTCRATFGFVPQRGEQVRIEGVPCT